MQDRFYWRNSLEPHVEVEHLRLERLYSSSSDICVPGINHVWFNAMPLREQPGAWRSKFYDAAVKEFGATGEELARILNRVHGKKFRKEYERDNPKYKAGSCEPPENCYYIKMVVDDCRAVGISENKIQRFLYILQMAHSIGGDDLLRKILRAITTDSWRTVISYACTIPIAKIQGNNRKTLAELDAALFTLRDVTWPNTGDQHGRAEFLLMFLFDEQSTFAPKNSGADIICAGIKIQIKFLKGINDNVRWSETISAALLEITSQDTPDEIDAKFHSKLDPDIHLVTCVDCVFYYVPKNQLHVNAVKQRLTVKLKDVDNNGNLV